MLSGREKKMRKSILKLTQLAFIVFVVMIVPINVSAKLQRPFMPLDDSYPPPSATTTPISINNQ
jgi:hypothetical protein